MPTYELVNPYISGDLTTQFDDDTENGAAERAWTALSSKIVNNVPRFAFTLKNTTDDSLSHFVVKERISKKHGTVNFKITQLKLELNDSQKKFILSKTPTTGGGKKDKRKHSHKKKHDSPSDSDSSSSSSDSSIDSEAVYNKIRNFRNKNSQMNYIRYNPFIYSSGEIGSIYMPIFHKLYPYIEFFLPNTYIY